MEISSILSRAPPAGLPQPTGLETRLTTAPALYGSNVAWMFLGFILMQTYTYYHNSQYDRGLFKAFIYISVLIEIAATGVECYVGYYYLVGGWGDIAANVVEVPPKAFLFQPLFDAVLGTMVQSFFAWRIWVFGVVAEPQWRLLSKLASALIVLLSFLALACSVAFPILFFKVDSQPSLWATTKPVVTTWTVASAVADIIITSCMFAILRHARSKTYLTATRDTLSRLIRLTVQTGSLTSLLAIATIAIFLREPFGNMHTLPAYWLGKSYAMSLLANVNARVHKPTGDGKTTEMSTQPSLAFAPPKNRVRKLKLGLFSRSTTTGMTSVTDPSTISGYGVESKAVKHDNHDGSDGTQSKPEQHEVDDIQLQSLPERDRSVRCLSDLVV